MTTGRTGWCAANGPAVGSGPAERLADADKYGAVLYGKRAA